MNDISSRFKTLRSGISRTEKETKGEKERVLIVDDLEGIREELKRILDKDSNLEVLTAESGEEALDIIRQCKGDFAYVNLDVIMPGINGFETYEQMHREFPSLLAGFCTAYHGQRKTLEDV